MFAPFRIPSTADFLKLELKSVLNSIKVSLSESASIPVAPVH